MQANFETVFVLAQQSLETFQDATEVLIASRFSSFDKIAFSFASRLADISGVVKEFSSPLWLEVRLKVKEELLGFLQFFDIQMGSELSSEEEKQYFSFSVISCIVSAMKGCEMKPFWQTVSSMLRHGSYAVQTTRELKPFLI